MDWYIQYWIREWAFDFIGCSSRALCVKHININILFFRMQCDHRMQVNAILLVFVWVVMVGEKTIWRVTHDFFFHFTFNADLVIFTTIYYSSVCMSRISTHIISYRISENNSELYINLFFKTIHLFFVCKNGSTRINAQQGINLCHFIDPCCENIFVGPFLYSSLLLSGIHKCI